MARWGLTIDLGRCTGCNACVLACRQENNVPVASEKTMRQGRELDWIRVLTDEEGDYEDLAIKQSPVMCQHCDAPPCVPVCPTEATYKDSEGIVGQIYPRCIGCRYCTNACPYGVKGFNWSEPEWPGNTKLQLNPDVSLRYKGIVEKCTFCHHRLQKAREQARFEGREIVEGDYTPACVEVCPTGAMRFGDLDDPKSTVASLAKNPRSERLLEDLGTEPKVYYLRKPDGGEL